MTERTPQDAVRAHQRSLQEVVSCVLSGRFTRQAGDPFALSPVVHGLVLNRALPTRLSGPSRLFLIAQQRYTIPHDLPGYRLQVVAYSYTLSSVDGRELIAFHSEPLPLADREAPHLHVGRAIAQEYVDVGDIRIHPNRLHIPTGIVNLAQVVRMLINDFQVTPLRDDWHEVLERNEVLD